MGLNWLDIIIICILIFGALDGMFKGFIVSFFNIGGIFISLYVAKYFSKPAASFIVNHTLIYGDLKGIFERRMSTLDFISLNVLKIVNTKNTPIEDVLTSMFINIACFLCLFIICSVIINVVRDSLKLRVRRSSLKHVDRVGGFVIGFLKSVIIIFLFFAVLTPIIGMLTKNNEIMLSINSSRLAKYFLLYNFVIPWFEKLNYFKGQIGVVNMLKMIKYI